MALDKKDLKYYKDLVGDDKVKHKEMVDLNSPDEVIAGYNGQFYDGSVGIHPHDQMMIEDYLFIGANTILPSFFFQLPRVHVRSKRFPFSAAVISALINDDFGEDDKTENQLCIVDTFLPYGFAVMKNGYNSKTGRIKEKANLFTGQTGGGKDPNSMEGDLEYIEFEKSIGLRQSPKYTYLDSTQPFGKGNHITFYYQRTLQQIINSNLYNLSDNFLSHFKARTDDVRKTKLGIYEMFIMIGKYAHKLVYLDEWEEELAWVRTEYTQLPISYLRFGMMGDVLYGISHGKLGLNAQKELNYLCELWKKHIDNIRNQIGAWRDALSEAGHKTLMDNKIGGVVEFVKPLTSAAFAPLQSASMDPNLFGNINNVREYLKLLMSTTGGKGGGAESELATTERNKAIGDALRSSGMQDAIRAFVVDQLKQRIKNYIKLADPQRILVLTGENIINPMDGKKIVPGTELVVGGKDGYQLKELIDGDIDLDYAFDVDISSAQRPDYPVIRKQLAEGITLGMNAQGALNDRGKKFRVDLAVEDYFRNFDTIPDAEKYIEDMTEEEKTAYEQAKQLQAEMQLSTGKPAPKNETVQKGAETVKTGAEGLTP